MSEFVKKQYNCIANISPEDARDYLLKNGYFTEVGILPGIIKASGLEDIKLEEIDWDNKKFPARTKPIKITTSKQGKGKRIFGLFHPYLYIHLVNELTQCNTWKDIVLRLSSETSVLVYSVPILTDVVEKITPSGWQFFSNIDFYSLSLDYEVVVEFDIQNFYGSIYTHSIPWSILGKETAKTKTGDYSLSSNRIDKLLQNSNDGQTNGILIGNVVSNLIAEIVMKDIDSKISEKIKDFDAKILRYRDDYKLLCKDHYVARQIIDYLTNLLSEEYGFVLNESKTKMYSYIDDNSDKNSHIAKSILNQYKLKAGDSWSGEQLFNYLKDMVSSHCYVDNKHYLDNRIFDLITALREDTLKIKGIDLWGVPIVNIILKSFNNQLMIGTYGYALLSEIISVVKKEDKKLAKKLINIILKYNSKSDDLVGLWVYIICKGYDESKSKEVLASKNSPIFMMIKNSSSKNIEFFNSRDEINKSDLNELKKFSLIVNEKLEEINEENSSFIKNVDDDIFDKWQAPYNR